MAVTTLLYPTADGTDVAWALGAGASTVIAVSPPDDGGATYIFTLADARHGFAVTPLPPQAAVVGSHTTRRRTRQVTNTGNGNTFLRLAGSYTNGAVVAEGAYANHDDTNLAKPGGGVYTTPAQVNATELGVQSSTNTGEQDCDTLSWFVDWSPIPGDFAAFAASIIGPLLGCAIALHDIPLLVGAILARSRGVHRIGAESFRQLFEELRRPRRRYAWL
jgi:hypothetical protein